MQFRSVFCELVYVIAGVPHVFICLHICVNVDSVNLIVGLNFCYLICSLSAYNFIGDCLK